MAATNGAPAPPAVPKSPWLDAHTDVVACIRSHTSCLQMVDLAGDSDYRLLVADFDVRSRVPILLNPPLSHPSFTRARARGSCDDARGWRERGRANDARAADEATRVSPLQRKLKVFRGTKMIVEHALLDQPVALCAFYTDEARRAPPSAASAAPRAPSKSR